MRPAPNPSRAIALKLLSVTAFVAMASLIKATSDAVPPGQAVFFRSFFAMVVIIGWLVARGNLRTGLKVADPMSHVWRGLVGTTAMGLMFAGLGLLPLPEVTAIGYAAPLLVVILAAMFLGEQVRFFRLSAVAIGLLGVLIVLSPRLTSLEGGASDREMLGAVVVLAGAAGAALAQVFVRKMVETEETSAIVFWFSITSTLMSLLTIPYGWQAPSLQVASMLILAGLLGGLGQIGLTSAYRYADAGVIAPFDYFSMLLALVVGYFVFGEVPTLTVLFGASVVIAAGILIIWRERQLGLERAKQRESTQQKGL